MRTYWIIKRVINWTFILGCYKFIIINLLIFNQISCCGLLSFNSIVDPSPSTDANTPVDNERIAPGLQIDLNLPAGEAEGGEEPPVEEAEGGEKEAPAEEAVGGEEAEY